MWLWQQFLRIKAHPQNDSITISHVRWLKITDIPIS